MFMKHMFATLQFKLIGSRNGIVRLKNLNFPFPPNIPLEWKSFHASFYLLDRY